MNIFVTGSTGFIGSHFLTALVEKYRDGAKIYCLVREIPETARQSVEYVQGTLEKITKHSAILAKCDYVFHIAANADYSSDADYDSVNLKPTREMVDCVKSGNLKNFIFLSTIGAVDRESSDRCLKPLTARSAARPRSAYGVSKLEAEKHIRSSGIPFTIIRPAWVYGGGMRAASHIQAFATMTAKGSAAYKMNFPGRVSLIHVSDLAQSMVNAVGNEKIIGKTYFAETESKSIGEIFKIIAQKILNKKIRQFPVPSFSFLISRIHSLLPLSINNLFIDYLRASDPDYKTDFQLREGAVFQDGVKDVLADNPELNGLWVITGANSGIGFALARRLREKGYGKRLFLVDKNVGNIRQNFPEALCSQTDLSKENEIKLLVENLSKSRIKVLVNNAGIGFRGGIEELSEEQILSTVDVNIKAPVLMVKRLLKQLQRSRSTIVNVASNVAHAPLPFMSIYSSSKAFLVNWSESLTYEIGKTNKVITFTPSGTLTQFQKNAGVKILNDGKTLMTPEFVAEKIETAVKKERAVVFLGWETKLLLMATSILPRSKRIGIWGKLFEKLR